MQIRIEKSAQTRIGCFGNHATAPFQFILELNIIE